MVRLSEKAVWINIFSESSSTRVSIISITLLQHLITCTLMSKTFIKISEVDSMLYPKSKKIFLRRFQYICFDLTFGDNSLEPNIAC